MKKVSWIDDQMVHHEMKIAEAIYFFEAQTSECYRKISEILEKEQNKRLLLL